MTIKPVDSGITEKVAAICGADQNLTCVVNGRFKGGYITRHYGDPANGVNAIQMELACRGYMEDPATPTPDNWPSRLNPSAPILPILQTVIESFLP